MNTILAQARAMSYRVGSNLKGAGLGAAWTSLLPHLDVDAVLVLGRIAPAERTALDRLASHVVQVDDARGMAAFVGSPTKRLAAHSLTLVRVGRGGDSLLRRSPGAAADIAALLSPHGSIYLDGAAARSGGAPPGLLGVSRAAEPLVVVPRFGTARAVFPAADPRVAQVLHELGYLPPKGGQPFNARLRNRALRAVMGTSGRDAILAIASDDLPHGPPAYVRELAAAAGHELSGDAWGLIASGDYASQKVLLLLMDLADRKPTSIIKLSTDPRHLGRLVNEGASLRAVAGLDLPPSARVPGVLFSGEHAGRAVVGQEWIRARPLPSLLARGDDPLVAAATAWLSALGLVTARPRSAADVGIALRDLLNRFDATFSLPASEMAVLEACVATIERHAGAIPIVRQHGDPGAWNMLVDGSGRLVVLDWESSESDGMPLWDLFYFQRSVGSLIARREGARRTLDAALRHFVTATPIQARFAADVREHADRVGLDRTLVEPMFYACWMHRALKEATRRKPTRLHEAHYLRLLRGLIAQRAAPALRHFTGSDSPPMSR